MTNDEIKIHRISGTGTTVVVIGILGVLIGVASIISGQFDGTVLILLMLAIPFLIWGINVVKDSNKPRIIINYKGIYLQESERFVPWSYVDRIVLITSQVHQSANKTDSGLYVVCKDGIGYKVEISGLNADSNQIKQYISKYSRMYFFN